MIYFKLLLGFATIAIIIFNIIKGFSSPAVKTNKVLYTDSEITLSNETNSSIRVNWQSETKEIGSVQYGIIQNVYYQSKSEQVPINTHGIELTSLSACTKYYYQVSSESMLFDKENGSFTTLCENAKIHKTNN